MESKIVDAVSSVLPADKMALIDEVSMQYITEILSDVDVLPMKTINESLATLLVSLDITENEKESVRILKDISSHLLVGVDEIESSSSDNEEPLSPAKRPRTAPLPPLKGDQCTKLTVEEVIALTYDLDPRVRKATLRDMCPCHVKSNIEALWKRIMEMYSDPDPNVRYQVMHNLCDGSPACREDDVIHTLEAMHNDPDKKVRRRVHQVLTHYRKTGKWNIL